MLLSPYAHSHVPSTHSPPGATHPPHPPSPPEPTDSAKLCAALPVLLSSSSRAAPLPLGRGRELRLQSESRHALREKSCFKVLGCMMAAGSERMGQGSELQPSCPTGHPMSPWLPATTFSKDDCGMSQAKYEKARGCQLGQGPQ